MSNKTRVKIEIKDYKNVDKALKVFKQKLLDYNLKNEYKKRSHHISKSEKNRLKKAESLRRMNKKNNKDRHLSERSKI